MCVCVFITAYVCACVHLCVLCICVRVDGIVLLNLRFHLLACVNGKCQHPKVNFDWHICRIMSIIITIYTC